MSNLPVRSLIEHLAKRTDDLYIRSIRVVERFLAERVVGCDHSLFIRPSNAWKDPT